MEHPVEEVSFEPVSSGRSCQMNENVGAVKLNIERSGDNFAIMSKDNPFLVFNSDEIEKSSDILEGSFGI